MAKKQDKKMIVGLDIGTSNVLVVVGEVQSDGAVNVIGVGSHVSRGLKKGVVTE